MYVLYGGRYTRAYLAQMVMAEGDIDYELREISIIDQEHRSPEFLAINPAGHVPALITPAGDVLYETPAINLYLAERHTLTHLVPGVDEPERGLFLSGLFFLAGDLEPVMKRYFYPHRYVFHEEDSPVMKQESQRIALERFAVIEQRLRAGGPYHLGERFSLIDLTMTFWAENIEVEDASALDPCPGVRKCSELVRGRPKLVELWDQIRQWRKEYVELQARGEGVK